MLKLDDLLEAKHKPVSKWYPLGEKTQRSGGDGSRGSLQVIAQWRYNKDLDFEPFSATSVVSDRFDHAVPATARRRRCGRSNAHAAVCHRARRRRARPGAELGLGFSGKRPRHQGQEFT